MRLGLRRWNRCAAPHFQGKRSLWECCEERPSRSPQTTTSITSPALRTADSTEASPRAGMSAGRLQQREAGLEQNIPNTRPSATSRARRPPPSEPRPHTARRDSQTETNWSQYAAELLVRGPRCMPGLVVLATPALAREGLDGGLLTCVDSETEHWSQHMTGLRVRGPRCMPGLVVLATPALAREGRTAARLHAGTRNA